jgi:hypothetical protein
MNHAYFCSSQYILITLCCTDWGVYLIFFYCHLCIWFYMRFLPIVQLNCVGPYLWNNIIHHKIWKAFPVLTFRLCPTHTSVIIYVCNIDIWIVLGYTTSDMFDDELRSRYYLGKIFEAFSKLDHTSNMKLM